MVLTSAYYFGAKKASVFLAYVLQSTVKEICLILIHYEMKTRL